MAVYKKGSRWYADYYIAGQRRRRAFTSKKKASAFAANPTPRRRK